MSHYLIKLVYQIVCGDGQHVAQFDEQLRFITAVNEEEALAKGRSIGLQEEDVFCNDKKQLVQWKFINVTELHPLAELMDGAEVFSQLKEMSDDIAYSNFVHHKASILEQKFSAAKLQIA